MAYKYDVFISYRRENTSKRWVEESFLPIFRSFLSEALGGREVTIFRDVEGIEGGQNWKAKICRALAYSKCLVPVFLPSYFHSEWCVRELSIIYDRQKKCGLNTIERPNGLIIPLKVRDGKYFPEKLQEINILNCNDYYRIGGGFETTPRFVDFQDILSKWVEEVANAIEGAPEWDESWLSEDYLSFTINEFSISREIKMQTPML